MEGKLLGFRKLSDSTLVLHALQVNRMTDILPSQGTESIYTFSNP